MQGIFGASLRDVVVMQHCLCVMCFYWNKFLILSGSHYVLLLAKEGLEGSEIEKASLSTQI